MYVCVCVCRSIDCNTSNYIKIYVTYDTDLNRSFSSPGLYSSEAIGHKTSSTTGTNHGLCKTNHSQYAWYVHSGHIIIIMYSFSTNLHYHYLGGEKFDDFHIIKMKPPRQLETQGDAYEFFMWLKKTQRPVNEQQSVFLIMCLCTC